MGWGPVNKQFFTFLQFTDGVHSLLQSDHIILRGAWEGSKVFTGGQIAYFYRNL